MPRKREDETVNLNRIRTSFPGDFRFGLMRLSHGAWRLRLTVLCRSGADLVQYPEQLRHLFGIENSVDSSWTVIHGWCVIWLAALIHPACVR